jgi:hypothetical protein
MVVLEHENQVQVVDLMMRIKEGPYEEDLTHVDTDDMEVWRFESLTLRGVKPDGIDDLVSLTFASDKGQELAAWDLVMELQLQDTEPLVVRVKHSDKGVHLCTSALCSPAVALTSMS